MSCYHPLLGLRDQINDKGRWTYKVVGPWSVEARQLDPTSIKIPCGRCIGCRLEYSRAWADRMILELDHSKTGIFVTLTYDNDHVPFTEAEYTGEFGCLSLDKRDFQLFLKRLRKHFDEKQIRFYLAGEYGSKSYRPHGHAILFGLSIDDFPDKVFYKRNKFGDILYTSDSLSKIWKNGYAVFSDVSWKTCAYVSRYVQKKVFRSTEWLSDFYGAEPEFSLCSRRPGIAGFFPWEHQDVFQKSKIYVPGKDEGIALPSYFLDKLKDDSPKNVLYNQELYDKIKKDRVRFASDKELLKLQRTDLSFIDQLEIEENKKLAQAAVLRRELE